MFYENVNVFPHVWLMRSSQRNRPPLTDYMQAREGKWLGLHSFNMAAQNSFWLKAFYTIIAFKFTKPKIFYNSLLVWAHTVSLFQTDWLLPPSLSSHCISISLEIHQMRWDYSSPGVLILQWISWLRNKAKWDVNPVIMSDLLCCPALLKP